MAKKKAKELKMIGTRNYEAEKENCKIKKFLCVFEAAAERAREKERLKGNENDFDSMSLSLWESKMISLN